jgi:hypothetical protein
MNSFVRRTSIGHFVAGQRATGRTMEGTAYEEFRVQSIRSMRLQVLCPSGDTDAKENTHSALSGMHRFEECIGREFIYHVRPASRVDEVFAKTTSSDCAPLRP